MEYSPPCCLLYIDELLERLSAAGVGCYIGERFMGAFSYADDITLLSPTVGAIRTLLRVADKFAVEYDLMFNASKSKLITFNQSTQPADVQILFRGATIPCGPEDMHLGHIFGPDSLNRSIESRVQDMVKRANILLAQLGFASCDVKYRLFKTLCMGLYGNQLWDFSVPAISSLYTAWRKIVRRIYAVPYRTHNVLVHMICEDMPPDVQLHRRALKFVSALAQSDNSIVRFCFRLLLNGSRSAVAESVNFISAKYNLDKYICFENWARLRTVISHKSAVADAQGDCVRASVIRDMIRVRENLYSSILSEAEVTHIINERCTS